MKEKKEKRSLISCHFSSTYLVLCAYYVHQKHLYQRPLRKREGFLVPFCIVFVPLCSWWEFDCCCCCCCMGGNGCNGNGGQDGSAGAGTGTAGVNCGWWTGASIWFGAEMAKMDRPPPPPTPPTPMGPPTPAPPAPPPLGGATGAGHSSPPGETFIMLSLRARTRHESHPVSNGCFHSFFFFFGCVGFPLSVSGMREREKRERRLCN